MVGVSVGNVIVMVVAVVVVFGAVNAAMVPFGPATSAALPFESLSSVQAWPAVSETVGAVIAQYSIVTCSLIVLGFLVGPSLTTRLLYDEGVALCRTETFPGGGDAGVAVTVTVAAALLVGSSTLVAVTMALPATVPVKTPLDAIDPLDVVQVTACDGPLVPATCAKQ